MSGRARSKGASIRLTERDLKMFQKLNTAGWLTTRQVGNFFFAGKTNRMVCKRLQKLVAAGYVAQARIGSTAPALYRLASRGKQALVEHTALSEENISIPKHLPRKIRHFTAINDLRFHLEQLDGERGARLVFFFSERELYPYYQSKAASDTVLVLLSKYKIVPDAIAKIRITCESMTREVNVALEYDAGTEHAAFFGRTKVEQYTALYKENSEWLGDFKVLTFARSARRVVSLMRQVVERQPPPHLFYFAVADKLRQRGWEALEVFLDPYDFFLPGRRGARVEVIEKEVQAGAIPKHALVTVPATGSRKGFSRENSGT